MMLILYKYCTVFRMPGSHLLLQCCANSDLIGNSCDFHLGIPAYTHLQQSSLISTQLVRLIRLGVIAGQSCEHYVTTQAAPRGAMTPTKGLRKMKEQPKLQHLASFENKNFTGGMPPEPPDPLICSKLLALAAAGPLQHYGLMGDNTARRMSRM